ncbi:MAG: bifunctional 5,10-methylenetetrahydrofolate dehydrogenase/5,10-methenyltetrahydrofolate cyclohydrolase [Candidatus Eiseniibacteriota bacterium]|nr:MAG: bifunctional 5,10-methylenetetrahydrofolate dehydrogenase/5,10-methenyltetrahydrofolate cyclohydrolase [Candidatus Eisenbacteria bacterium]
MAARILDGKKIAAELRTEIGREVEELAGHNIVPALTMVRVGEDPASIVYMNAKARLCDKVGVRSRIVSLPVDSSESRVKGLLEEVNEDPAVHGAIVQLPLPQHLDPLRILSLLDPAKDVDGFHPLNAGRLAMGTPLFVPATPMGIHVLLERSGVGVEGAHVVVMGRSNIVGKPLANFLSIKRSGLNATVTLCHSASSNLERVVRSGDIVVAAIGRAEFVTGSMVSPGAVVVDVGMNRVADESAERGYRLVGDVKYDEVKEIASAITPVPGGVGPMTVAMLLRNTVQACRALGGL